MSNSNGSHDSLPEADPILTALLERVKDPAQVRETVLSYYEAMGIPRGNVSGFEKHAPVKPLGSEILSRVVVLPSGARVLLDGARTEEELDRAEENLRKQRGF
jgi:hypothetical protein